MYIKILNNYVELYPKASFNILYSNMIIFNIQV